MNRSILLACPKFTDFEANKAKLVDILKTAGPASLTVVRMEVPCCGGLVKLAEDALHEANSSIPLKVVMLGLNGEERR